MLSIFLAIFATCFSFFLLKKRSSKIWMASFFIFFNWFILELIVYLYLIHIVHSGTFLFLIGNQNFLDTLIKKDMKQHLFVHKDAHNSFYQIDPVLGYTVGKNKNFWVYHSNSQGLRADREYPVVPSPKILRLAVFGDSFVFGDGESNENIWPSMLEKSVDGLEVMNFGVSGYGLSASYLRYLKEGLEFHPDIVFMNYIMIANRDWPENTLIGGTDLRRATLYYPLLTIKNGELRVKPFTPLDLFDPMLKEDYLYKPLHLKGWEFFLRTPIFSLTNTGLFIKNAYLTHKFNLQLKDQDGNPSIEAERLKYSEVIVKNLLELTQKQHTMVIFFCEQEASSLPQSIQNLLQQYSSHVVYIDGKKLMENLFSNLKLDSKSYLNPTKHYNALGNRVYTEAIKMVLKNSHWGGGDRSFEFCPKTNRFQNIYIESCQ